MCAGADSDGDGIPDPGTTMSRDVSTSSPLAPVSAPRMFYQVKDVLPLAE